MNKPLPGCPVFEQFETAEIYQMTPLSLDADQYLVGETSVYLNDEYLTNVIVIIDIDSIISTFDFIHKPNADMVTSI